LRLRQSLLQKLGVEKDIEYAAGTLVLIDVKRFGGQTIAAIKALSRALVSGYHPLHEDTGGGVWLCGVNCYPVEQERDPPGAANDNQDGDHLMRHGSASDVPGLVHCAPLVREATSPGATGYRGIPFLPQLLSVVTVSHTDEEALADIGDSLARGLDWCSLVFELRDTVSLERAGAEKGLSNELLCRINAEVQEATLLERNFIASAVKTAMNAERPGLRRRVQDAMDNEMLSESALKSSKAEKCYDFAAAFQSAAFGVTTLIYDAAGDLLDENLCGEVLSSWRKRSDFLEDFMRPLPGTTGSTTKVATWDNNEGSEAIVKAWVGYEELSGGCSVLDLARAEAAFWSHLAASFLKYIVLEKALAVSGAANDASKSRLLAELWPQPSSGSFPRVHGILQASFMPTCLRRLCEDARRVVECEEGGECALQNMFNYEHDSGSDSVEASEGQSGLQRGIVRSNPTRHHRGLVVAWKAARSEDPVQQEVLSVDASFIRSQLYEWIGPVPDCIVGSRDGDGDFDLPTVLGDRAFSLVAAIDNGTKRSMVLKVPSQGDSASTTKVSVGAF
jgi:hypothetical protein